MTDRHITVIGVGNPSRSDDRAGLQVARRLREHVSDGTAGNCRIVECSGEATALMAAWANARAVIIADAVLSGASPGTVHRLDAAAEPVPASFSTRSTHSFGLAQAIELARALGQLPQRIVIYGIEGASFDHGEELSPQVAAAMPRAVDRILAEIRSQTRQTEV